MKAETPRTRGAMTDNSIYTLPQTAEQIHVWFKRYKERREYRWNALITWRVLT